MREISPFSRHVATPSDEFGGAATPSEKIYSFFLRDLAKASADKNNYGQTIACPPGRWVNGIGSCWEEKSIHEATRRGSGIKDGRWKIASVALKAALYLRSPKLDPLRGLRGRTTNQFAVNREQFHDQ